MARTSIAIVTGGVLAAVLLGVVLSCRPSAKDVARAALSKAVGGHTVDCGWSSIDQDRSIQRDCVFEARRNGRSFIVLYEVIGKEGDPYVVGLAGDGRDDVYMLTIESGDTFPKLYRRFAKSGRQLEPAACPKPVKLQVNGEGRVVCSWR